MSLLPLRLSVPEDFDFPWAVRFLAARAVPSLEMVRDDEYSRVIWPATLEAQDARSRGGAPVVLGARFSPASEVDAALTALPGIGPWTASYVRLRAFGDRDAFPAADLGVLKALAARGVARDAVAAVAERWRPWRGYAALHLWRSLEPDA